MTAFTRNALALTGLAALALAPPAHAQAGATTINFDNLTAQAQAGGYGFAGMGPSHTTQGYTFAAGSSKATPTTAGGFNALGGDKSMTGAISPDGFIPPAVPEASTTVSFGSLLVLGLGGLVIAKKRKKSASSL